MRHKICHLHAAGLANPVHAADALLEDGGIPWQVHIDDRRRRILQIETDPARVGRQEHPAGWVTVKAVAQRAALVAGNAAMEQHMAPALGGEAALDQLMRAQPLAKDNHFRGRVFEQVVEQVHKFVNLDAMVRFMIDQKCVIAGHAHRLQRAGKAALVGIGQEAAFAPAVHDALDDGAVVVMVRHLLRRQSARRHREARGS